MTYRFYYWPIPFRGHFVRYALAFAGTDWQEAEASELIDLKGLPPERQPVQFMGPPVLHDLERDIWISQLQAVLDYLGHRLGLGPSDPADRAMTLKIVGDCIDVLEEITRHCGRSGMWTPETWEPFVSRRLPRWMHLFEATGRAHGLTETGGTMLGSDSPMLADLATAALWHTMTDKLPALRPVLDREAPCTAALSDRIAALPDIAEMRAAQDARSGDLYCGGQIEDSIRAMLARA